MHIVSVCILDLNQGVTSSNAFLCANFDKIIFLSSSYLPTFLKLRSRETPKIDFQRIETHSTQPAAQKIAERERI